MTIEIIPTVVPTSFDDVVHAADRVSGFAPTLHVDFADGIFAPNTTWLPTHVRHAVSHMGVSLEAHLMVQEPREIGKRLIAQGFTRIIGHIETMQEQTGGILSKWKDAGAQEVGLGILFATPLETLDPFVGSCDVIQMMSIASIGVQGIPYEPRAPERIAALHARHPQVLIADDGGVSQVNIAELARAGVRRFCVGSALAKAADPAAVYKRLIALAESAI